MTDESERKSIILGVDLAGNGSVSRQNWLVGLG